MTSYLSPQFKYMIAHIFICSNNFPLIAFAEYYVRLPKHWINIVYLTGGIITSEFSRREQ